MALFFLQQDIFTRMLALGIAMLSDWLDGYIARNYRLTSRLGTILDPIMDKFFVFFVLGVFIQEQRLTVLEAMAFLCRDFSVILFGLYLAVKGTLSSYEPRAIWCGKLTTTLQFLSLFTLALGATIPAYFYVIFILLGVCALFELYIMKPNFQRS